MHHDVNNVRSPQRRSTMMWSVEGRSFSLALFQTSWKSNPNPSDWSGWIFDQRCSINLIIRRVPLRIILLQESTVDRHHERIAVRSYMVCSIWVDWLYYKWTFSFWVRIFLSSNFLFVLCVVAPRSGVYGDATATYIRRVMVPSCMYAKHQYNTIKGLECWNTWCYTFQHKIVQVLSHHK